MRRTGARFLCLAILASGCATLARAPESRGRPSGGWLSHGRRLRDQGPGWRVLRDDAQGGHHWGTERLVAMVEEVAYDARPREGGVPLVVGDLSAARGGQVPRHASHRAGRDVDLLFFARDALTDQPVVTPEFVRYDRAGMSVQWPVALRFDAARNWRLVEAVVRARRVGVVRIFVAAWIEALLLAEARARGSAPWVVDRAEAVMRQPGDSAAHDDHFHVRVACTPDERAAGCVDYGPMWPWIEKDWDKGDSAPADDATVLAAMEPLTPGG